MVSEPMENIFNFLGKSQELHILNNWKLIFLPKNWQR